MIKSAGRNDLHVVEKIMDEIRIEDPSYWPYGLSTDQFNGGLYMVQKSASSEPVGFVGWQKIPEGDKAIGYYAIGILPAHRKQQFAKQAVSQVIREARKECDDVRAFIMAHNNPSKALAESLDVPVIEKSANRAQTLAALTGAVATPVFFDQVMNPENPVGESLTPWEWDKQRQLLGGFNAILGGIGGRFLGKGEVTKGLAPIALAPTKDLAIKGLGTLHKADKAIDESTKSLRDVRLNKPEVAAPGKNWAESLPKSAWAGAGLLGTGLLGTILFTAHQRKKTEEKKLAQSAAGRVRITLPTKDPDDHETTIELPVEDLGFSKNLRTKLRRDTRRKLVGETKERTKRRTKSASIESIVDSITEIEMRKYAGTANAAAAVPQRGPVGMNPAMGSPAQQMQQQEQAVANSIQPSTDANPQIMEAQQAAMQAEQQGQQQLAQMEQQSQQAQMEQQQQFQQEMMKAEQEKETLKLQLEKEKAIADLGKAQSKAQSEMGKGEGTVAQKLVGNRLGRLQKQVDGLGKVASNFAQTGTTGGMDPKTGLEFTKKQPGKLWDPSVLQRANTNKAVSLGVTPQVGIYRTSYGKVGDTLHDLFLRGPNTKPKAPKPRHMSYAELSNDPDRGRALMQVLTGQVTTNPMLAAT